VVENPQPPSSPPPPRSVIQPTALQPSAIVPHPPTNSNSKAGSKSTGRSKSKKLTTQQTLVSAPPTNQGKSGNAEPDRAMGLDTEPEAQPKLKPRPRPKPVTAIGKRKRVENEQVDDGPRAEPEPAPAMSENDSDVSPPPATPMRKGKGKAPVSQPQHGQLLPTNGSTVHGRFCCNLHLSCFQSSR
jgi:hypothetical protein